MTVYNVQIKPFFYVLVTDGVLCVWKWNLECLILLLARYMENEMELITKVYHGSFGVHFGFSLGVCVCVWVYVCVCTYVRVGG